MGWRQSIVLCQCWWTSIQGIPALFGCEGGGPSAKAYLCAKFCLLAVKAYMLLLKGEGGGGPFAEIYLSAKFYLMVVKPRHV